MKNVFVMGLDPVNLELLRTIEGDEPYRFHGLFEVDEVVHPPEQGYPSLTNLLVRARETFDRFPEPVDGIMGYWDFPTSVLVPLIARETGLPAPHLEAVARCEHKYWARMEQRESVPELVPRFQAVNPFSEDPLGDLELDFPFWIKPIKAHSSFLGFYIDGPESLKTHLAEIREQIGVIAEPFNEFLSYVQVPEIIQSIDGYHCIAEEITSAGRQCTLEGYVWRGNVEIFGIVDSVRNGEAHSSFTRYQYPSGLPADVQERMTAATDKVMRHIGYDGGAFNIEFFWNPDTDRISLLEINSRISKSHSPLFFMVDGCTNQKVSLDLALGQEPDFPRRKGACGVAAKFMLRFFEDGILQRVPDEKDIRELKRRFPEATVNVLTTQGIRLSDLQFQDSYSYEVAEIFLGTDNEASLLDRYDEACRILDFRVGPLAPEPA